MTHNAFRRVVSAVFVGACALAVLVALVPLAMILFFVVSQGLQSLNLAFFTSLPKPIGEPGGGMLNAFVGTLMLISLAALLAIPVGVLSGIYMSEYAGTTLATATRFAADTLNGVPSIVIGIFAYGIAVLPFRQFSALAGGLALGVMMIPIIARTTEELLLLVPGTMREGALALGATRAPLLFTSFNNQYFSTSIRQPIASMTVQIYTYAISPYQDQHRQAWAGALVLVTFVLACSLVARVVTARVQRRRG